MSCGFRERNSLYIAGGDIGSKDLVAEHALRQRAGLPGEYLDYIALKRQFGISREGAILSPGCADANPLQLSHALIASSIGRGAALFDAEARGYDSMGKSVFVTLDSGHVIEAGNVVLATGYAMPDFVKTDLHQTASSWAIATPTQDASRLWRGGILIWEASEPYLYARTTIDGRIIIGGEDDGNVIEPDARDRLMPAKAELILKKLAQLWPAAEAKADYIWSGAFGETEDGLPLIGQVSGYPRIHAAYGYGGNGITFSFLASRMIRRMIAGDKEAWFDEFALDRPKPGS